MTGTPKKWVIRSLFGNHMPCATLYAHFIRISWWGEETKCISSEKDPGENTGNLLLCRQKMNTILARRLLLTFFPIPKASLTSEGSEKKFR